MEEFSKKMTTKIFFTPHHVMYIGYMALLFLYMIILSVGQIFHFPLATHFKNKNINKQNDLYNNYC